MMIFYKEWLPLPKVQFRIMAMLADVGTFKGSITDIVRYFFLSAQKKNKDSCYLAITELATKEFLDLEIKGNELTITSIPKEEQIVIKKEWYDKIRLREAQGRSVGWEVVLKVLLWVCLNDYEDIITNASIRGDLGVSTSTICTAKRVLDDEFGAVVRSKVSQKLSENTFKTLGQHLGATAFWKTSDE